MSAQIEKVWGGRGRAEKGKGERTGLPFDWIINSTPSVHMIYSCPSTSSGKKKIQIMITKYNVILKSNDNEIHPCPSVLTRCCSKHEMKPINLKLLAAARGENGTDKMNAQNYYLWAISIGSEHLQHPYMKLIDSSFARSCTLVSQVAN